MRKNLWPEDLEDFLDQPKCAILATHFPNGRVLLSPVWQEWWDGGFTIFIPADDEKSKHMKRNPQVSLVVAEDLPPYRGIEVRGEARRVEWDLGPIMHRMAVRYQGAAKAADFVEAYKGISMECLRIEPGKLRVWDARDERDGPEEPV